MDTQQLTDLIRRHSGLIHKVAFAYCRDKADREDVIQEVALQLWRSRQRYDERFKESTWIYRIAINVAISFYRRERRHRERRLPMDDCAISITAPSAEPSEEVQHLLHCIHELGPLERALVLLYLDDYDHKSIADVLGITTSNVGTKLSRIKAKLRVAFEKDERTTQQENPHATR